MNQNENTSFNCKQLSRLFTINETSVLELFKNNILAFIYNNDILLYNLLKKSVECTIKDGNSGGLISLSQLSNEKIMSSYNNNTIKIWSANKCEHIIKDAHSEKIKQVIALSENKMASFCVENKIRNNIKIWNSEPPYNIIKSITIQQYNRTIKRLYYIKNIILIDFCICISEFNLQSCQCVTTYDISNVCNVIEFDDNHIMVMSKERAVKVNIKRKVIESYIELPFVCVSSMKLGNGAILCAGNKRLAVIEKMKVVQIIQCNNVDKLIPVDDSSFITSVNEFKAVDDSGEISYQNVLIFVLWKY